MHNDEVAKKRHERNQFSRTNKPIESDADKLGVAGEMAFAELIGIDHTPTASAPTRGYQFNLGPKTKIKVATSLTPGNLLVKEGKVTADVYVLAGCSGEPVKENVYFIGWAPASMVKAAEVRNMSKRSDYALPSHAIPRDKLVSMKGLLLGLNVPDSRVLSFPLSDPTTPPLPKIMVRDFDTGEDTEFKPLPIKRPQK